MSYQFAAAVIAGNRHWRATTADAQLHR